MAEADVVDQSTTQQTQQTTDKEVTLDDVYRDAGLDKQETQTQQTTQRQETTQQQTTTAKTEPLSIPDPYDAENFKAYLAREAAGKTALQQTVATVVAHLNAQGQQAALAATKSDIEKAVSTINEVVNHPKPTVIEATLDGMVRENPQLKAIWENRGKNPGAWDKALSIVRKQIAEDFSVKVDPSLVAAQRARKESQKQMATTARDDGSSPAEERLGQAQGAEFASEWQRLLGGN